MFYLTSSPTSSTTSGLCLEGLSLIIICGDTHSLSLTHACTHTHSLVHTSQQTVCFTVFIYSRSVRQTSAESHSHRVTKVSRHAAGLQPTCRADADVDQQRCATLSVVVVLINCQSTIAIMHHMHILND